MAKQQYATTTTAATATATATTGCEAYTIFVFEFYHSTGNATIPAAKCGDGECGAWRQG